MSDSLSDGIDERLYKGGGWNMNDDRELLRGFVCEGSQASFEKLVQRYTPMVFSSAQRRIGASHAEDVTQAVFIILAKKAPRLYSRKHQNIAGWLHTTTRYAALHALRSERRRMTHEKNASENEQILNPPDTPDSHKMITPLLDEGLDSLSNKDRNALLMRFFRGASHSEIGQTQNISENAANKRIERALLKLERFFGRRGVTASVVVITAAIAGEGTAMASTGMGAVCATMALSSSTTGSFGAAAFLASKTSATMLAAQAKTLVVTTSLCSVIIGSAAVAVHKYVMPDKPDFQLLRIEPFAMTYKGRTELPDGTFEFQINDRNSRETHFVKIGEEILGYVVKSHALKSKSVKLEGMGGTLPVDVSQLTLESADHTITLVKDKYNPTREWVAVIQPPNSPTTCSLAVGYKYNDGHITYQVTSINPETQTITVRSSKDGQIFIVKVEEHK